MPSSMIFASLVVLWLLILVPAVARGRQEVARPSVAALSGRVLERPQRRRGPATGHEREVDVMDEVSRADQDVDGCGNAPDRDAREHDDRIWERPPPRYRPGRGGFDPEAAALAARARYAFRQRVVLCMLVAAVGTAVVAVVALPALWWAHGAIDLALVSYLVYLRRQVRLEEAIRERRAARMAGTRWTAAADDPELDTWARRGRDVTRKHDEYGEYDEYDEYDEYEGAEDRDPDADGYLDERDHEQGDDSYELDQYRELDEEELDEYGERDEYDDGVAQERYSGEGRASRRVEQSGPEGGEPALPRLHPAPPPAVPAGTSLVEADEDDPELYDLELPAQPDYRRAAGE